MKPCNQCGEPLSNAAHQCEECGAEQKELSVKPFCPADAPPPEPSAQSSFPWEVIFEAGVAAIPIVFGLIGHHYFGTVGAIGGVVIGLSPWLIANII